VGEKFLFNLNCQEPENILPIDPLNYTVLFIDTLGSSFAQCIMHHIDQCKNSDVPYIHSLVYHV